MAECIGSNGDGWIIYQDSKGHWRWRRTLPGGAIVGASSNNYADRYSCEANAKRHGMDCTPVGQEENIEKLKKKFDGLSEINLVLAKEFSDLKKEAGKEMKKYTTLFYLFLFILFLIIGLSLSQELCHAFPKMFWTCGIIDPNDTWFLWVKRLLAKSLFIAPPLWIVLFLSKRRSEHQRLQQEYTHKAAVSNSFQGYKEQIEALGLEDKKLLEELLSTAIKTIGYNPSVTLGGSHGDNLPITEIAKFFKLLKK